MLVTDYRFHSVKILHAVRAYKRKKCMLHSVLHYVTHSRVKCGLGDVVVMMHCAVRAAIGLSAEWKSCSGH